MSRHWLSELPEIPNSRMLPLSPTVPIDHPFSSLLLRLEGQECWYVSCGGGASGSMFQLHCGGKVSRSRRLETVPLPMRDYEGEFGIGSGLSSWRLSRGREVLSTSQDDSSIGGKIATQTRMIEGSKIEKMALINETYDIKVTFSGGYELVIFCNSPDDYPNYSIWCSEFTVTLDSQCRPKIVKSAR